MKKTFSVKELIKYMEQHIGIFTLLASAVSLFMTGVFKIGIYFYQKGYYDYWRISDSYIEVRFGNIIYNFFGYMLMGILLMSFSYLYFYWYKIILSRNKWSRKIIEGISAFLIICLLVIIFLCFNLVINFGISIGEIILYIRYEFFSFVKSIGYLSFLIWGFLILCGWILYFILFGSIMKKSANKIENQEEGNSSKLSKKIGVIIFCIIFAADIILLGYSIYDTGKKSALEVKKIDIVSIQKKSYVVIERYQDKWILKEGKFAGERFIINHDHYMIKDIVGKDIKVKFLKDGEKIGDWIVDNEEFSQIVDK